MVHVVFCQYAVTLKVLVISICLMRLVGVAYLRKNLRCVQGYGIFNLKSQFSIFDSFRDIRVHICVFLKLVGDL